MSTAFPKGLVRTACVNLTPQAIVIAITKCYYFEVNPFAASRPSDLPDSSPLSGILLFHATRSRKLWRHIGSARQGTPLRWNAPQPAHSRDRMLPSSKPSGNAGYCGGKRSFGCFGHIILRAYSANKAASARPWSFLRLKASSV